MVGPRTSGSGHVFTSIISQTTTGGGKEEGRRRGGRFSGFSRPHPLDHMPSWTKVEDVESYFPNFGEVFNLKKSHEIGPRPGKPLRWVATFDKIEFTIGDTKMDMSFEFPYSTKSAAEGTNAPLVEDFEVSFKGKSSICVSAAMWLILFCQLEEMARIGTPFSVSTRSH